MPKRIKTKDILKDNPQLSADRVYRMLEAIKRLRDRGALISDGYNIQSPFDRQPTQKRSSGDEKTLVFRERR